MSSESDYIDALVGDLKPVRAMRAREGLALATIAGGATIVLTAALLGLRTDVAAGRFSPLFLFANGLLLAVALGSAIAVVRMGMPRVGHTSHGWKWVLAISGLLPAAALIMLTSGTETMPAAIVTRHEINCIAMGLLLGLLTATVLVAWLRRGAPTSTQRAGLLVGLASGSIGMLAFALHCPFDSFYHVGLWHALPVVLGGVLGRLIVPPLIRW
jgi:hypothetical protein